MSSLANKKKVIISMRSWNFNDQFKICAAELVKKKSKYFICEHGGGLIGKFDHVKNYIGKISNHICYDIDNVHKKRSFRLSPTLNVIYKKVFKIYLLDNSTNQKAVICNFPTRKLNLDNEFSEFNINSWLNKNRKIEKIIFIDQNIKKNTYIKKNILTKNLINLFIKKIDLINFIYDFIKIFIYVFIDLLLLRYGSILMLKSLTENLLVKNSDTSNYTFFFISQF